MNSTSYCLHRETGAALPWGKAGLLSLFIPWYLLRGEVVLLDLFVTPQHRKLACRYPGVMRDYNVGLLPSMASGEG